MIIIHVITGLGQGGAETMLYKLLDNMDSKKFKNVVISMTDEGVFANRLREIGVTVYCLQMSKGLTLFAAIFKYRKLLRKYSPEVVQSWMYHANVFALLMKPFIKKHKLLLNVRTSITNIKHKKRPTRFFIWLNAKLSNFADGVINNSKLSQQQHIKIGFCKENSFYLPNGFELDQFKPNHKRYLEFREKNYLDSECKLVGLLARYNPIKNHTGFLKVAKLLLQRCLQEDIVIKFVLAGRDCDTDNQTLVEKIKKYDLTQHVLLLGQVDSAQLLPCLNLHLLTSYEEGFPNVVGEAMSCGVPCVASDVGDCKSVIAKHGAVEKVDDYEALARESFKLLTLVPEDKRQIREYIRQNYSIEKIVDDYESLYSSVI